MKTKTKYLIEAGIKTPCGNTWATRCSLKGSARKNIICFAVLSAAAAAPVANAATTGMSSAIPWNQIGAKAGADYKGDGLSVTATETGARLHCVFQRMDGEATGEGLWLASTVTDQPSDRFRVVARQVGRVTPCAPAQASDANHRQRTACPAMALPLSGKINVAGQTVRFIRPGLTEEYSVSVDGVRQDFVVPGKPEGDGPLKVRLAVSGARVEQTTYGTQLVLTQSGRKFAYSRLRATDANGKELPARIEVDGRVGSPPPAAMGNEPATGTHGVASPTLAILVDDAGAAYPVRIDPTFSDANWISLSSVNGIVLALAVSGGTVYVGGNFTTARGNAVNYIAQWNGSSWSPLGAGVNSNVLALAVSGGTLYAGGQFTEAGGNTAHYIAQWNGSSWSALGSGMHGNVYALAVTGSKLYVGGGFTTAGGSAANYIAQWNGSSWSALGSGMDGIVFALAVSGTNLYVGGYFMTAGGNPANDIAQWNGSSWSPLGSGMGGGTYPYVYALAVSGDTLYAGGDFTTAGGKAANDIAQWNGSSWSALGSGMHGNVYALAVTGGTLYAGGDFTTAGGKVSDFAAEAYLVAPPGGLVDSIVEPTSGTANVRCYGNPGQQFGVQRTTNLAPPLWTTVNSSPFSPAADGSFTFVDTNAPPGTAYYRAFQY